MTAKDTKENYNICMDYCGTCPSLPDPRDPMLFCARGKSSGIIEKKGCKCPSCPVHAKYGLKGFYFCEKGKAP
jgi:hypothetical protein